MHVPLRSSIRRRLAESGSRHEAVAAGIVRSWAGVRGVGLIAILTAYVSSAVAASAITGTATFRERMALPPGAVFEATLEDVSRADAPSRVLGGTRIESPGPPPIRFSIAYEPAVIDARYSYVVRARITVGGKPMFTTDTAHPVLGGNGATHVDLLLKRVGATAPVPAAQRMRGIYTYLADAGVFTDCASGRKLPVVQSGDNAALESAYVGARAAPGALMLATVDGRVEMRLPVEGKETRPMLVVERFVEIQPGADCPAQAGPATLENTYWKLVSLHGAPVQLAEKQREPHLILQSQQKRLVGSSGCNRIAGAYTLDGERVSFSRTAGTMMACPQTVMELERAFLDTLAQVQRWRIDGKVCELLDASGDVVAVFEARYLK
jgi:uncharacterized lipoprotein YbaY/heat shock protein HslJ